MPRPAVFTALPVLGSDFPLPLDRPFTSELARDAGITTKVLGRLSREGYVRRLLKGVYVAAQATDGVRLRAEALTLVVPEHAVVVDWTAVWLYTGLLPPGDHLRVPPVSLFRYAGHTRLRNDLCRSGERTFLKGDVREVHELAVTTPLRTAWDVGRLVHRDRAIGALDGLLRTGAFAQAELLDGISRFRGQRGVVQLRALAPVADARAESPGESLLRLRWLDVVRPNRAPSPGPRTSGRLTSGRGAARAPTRRASSGLAAASAGVPERAGSLRTTCRRSDRGGGREVPRPDPSGCGARSRSQ